MRFSDFLVNQNVRNTVLDQKDLLTGYKLERPTAPQKRKILAGKPFISFELEDLNNN